MADPVVANQSINEAIADSIRDEISLYALIAGHELVPSGTGYLLRPLEKDGSPDDDCLPAISLTGDSIPESLRQLQRRMPADVFEAEPQSDPAQVAAIAGKILESYVAEDGHTQLAGCSLDERAFLQITYVQDNQWRHLWFDQEGAAVTDELADRLGFHQLTPRALRLRPSDRPVVDEWLQSAQPSIDPDCPVVAITVIWCHWVQGKISFRFKSGASCSIEVHGWARDWISGVNQAPKYRCPVSGIESYHLVALDDECVTVAESLSQCEVSGERAICSDLETCAASGQRVLRSKLTTCPASGDLLLPDRMVLCGTCGRHVCPSTIAHGECCDCRTQQSIDASDLTVAAVIEAVPDVGNIKSWRGWVRDEQAMLVASRMMRQWLFLLQRDGESWKILRRTTKPRWSRRWEEA